MLSLRCEEWIQEWNHNFIRLLQLPFCTDASTVVTRWLRRTLEGTGKAEAAKIGDDRSFRTWLEEECLSDALRALGDVFERGVDASTQQKCAEWQMKQDSLEELICLEDLGGRQRRWRCGSSGHS